MWKGKWTPICGHLFWDNEYGAKKFCQKLDSKFNYGKITKRTDKPLERDAIWIGKSNREDEWLSFTGECNKLETGGECHEGNYGSCAAGVGPSMEIECFSGTSSTASPGKRKRRDTENTDSPTTSNETKSVIKKLDILLDPEKEETREKMKEYARKQFEEQFGNMSWTESYESMFQLMWYSQLPCYDVNEITSTRMDEMSIIKKCSWKGKEISCPAIFEMQPTDRGMCCSFNMEKAENIFQKSKYTELISQAQKETFENRQVQDYNKILTICDFGNMQFSSMPIIEDSDLQGLILLISRTYYIYK